MKIGVLFLALFLAAGRCAESTPETVVPAQSTDTEAACLTDGGTWGRGGMAPFDICIRPTADAGKSCQSSTDCESTCLANGRAAAGICAPQTPYFGCFQTYENGERPMLCVD